MWEDPIVAETRALRNEMMEDAGNDLDSLFNYLLEEQAKHKDKLVRLPPRKAIPLGVVSDD